MFTHSQQGALSIALLSKTINKHRSCYPMSDKPAARCRYVLSFAGGLATNISDTSDTRASLVSESVSHTFCKTDIVLSASYIPSGVEIANAHNIETATTMKMIAVQTMMTLIASSRSFAIISSSPKFSQSF